MNYELQSAKEVVRPNAIVDKSKAFAVRIIRLYKYLTEVKKEYTLSRQVLRSGTSVGANIREAQRAQSTKDFLTKLYIAEKEADETAYWLELLHDTNYLNDKEYGSIYPNCEEIIRLLAAIIISTKSQI